MELVLFAAYLILFSWLVIRVPFFKRSGLTPAQLVILFLIKVMAGIIYGWIGVYYGNLQQMVDSWWFHYEGLKLYEHISDHPSELFSGLFNSNYEHGYRRFLSSRESWWNDLHANLFIRFLAVLDIFSFGNYYINVIFYSFLTLFGPIAVYRTMKDAFASYKWVVLAGCFLIPSFLYWTSGIHRDGLIFVCLALSVFYFYFAISSGFSWKKIAGIILCLVGLLFLRNFLLVVFLPALLVWYTAERYGKPILVYITGYAVLVLLFFTARYIFPSIDLPAEVVTKQVDFLSLFGNSAVEVNKLEPTFLSFLQNLPQALDLTFLRPYPSNVTHLLSLVACIETYLLLVILLVFVAFPQKIKLSAFHLFCFAFSIAVILMIGYTVNFIGAIVRYRSLVFPFLYVPILAMTDWNKIGRLAHIKK